MQVEVVSLASSAVTPLRRVVDSPDVVGNLASAANFARFQLPELFPQLHRALYLDIDTIVKGDITELWHYLVSSTQMMVAVPRYVYIHVCGGVEIMFVNKALHST